MNAPDRLLTSREAADYLGCSERHVFANPKIPRVRLPGRGTRPLLRFRLSALDAYILAHTVEPVKAKRRAS